ncbi:MATE family efflux transporter [Methanogenium organophilum]|uniref:MATE family efflux transporter n=1 Tax=Methanogenium organophilum TaxID=2199 RepID=A0A9X9S603_METOG|nr:MATE family efflux transporter [Methanogenium organophilum]WAI02070.1 MATE family efflux transporter [Methanogenium organophilum]
MTRPMTVGVETLLGDPKPAIRSLAWPVMVGMVLQTVYNLTDAFWVAGISADALAAVGFFFPFFFAVFGFANGMGVGAGSAISRYIGMRDAEGANRVVSHTVVLVLVFTVLITITGFLVTDHFDLVLGETPVATMASDYADIIFLGTFFILSLGIGSAILRGEGDAKRTMYVMLVSSLVNIVLDPIFIYGLGLGVPGAAWATVVAFTSACIPIFWWIFVKRDTHVQVSFAGFTFSRTITREILKVGLPASIQHISMAMTTFSLNIIILMVATTDGIAIYTTGWRVVTIGIMPLIAISTAVVSVCGAAYGAGIIRKAEEGHLYAIRLGVAISLAVTVAVYLCAPYIALAFTYSEDAAHLYPGLVVFLQTVCFFFPAVSFGVFSSSLLQGFGRGIDSLVVTLLRTIGMTVLTSYLFAVILGWGIMGVWWGLVVGNTIGAGIAYLWARVYTRILLRRSGMADDVV